MATDPRVTVQISSVATDPISSADLTSSVTAVPKVATAARRHSTVVVDLRVAE